MLGRGAPAALKDEALNQQGILIKVKLRDEATFTFRVDGILKQYFTAAAKACDRTGAQLMRDFMRNFVQQQQELLIESQSAQANEGSFVDRQSNSDLTIKQKDVDLAVWRSGLRRKVGGVEL